MLKRTPLHGAHLSENARMIDFAGWEMPVQYSGPLQEHNAVRNAAGIFDVSHMGEIEIQGPGGLSLLQRLTTNDVSRLEDNQIQYSTLTSDNGGVIDDLLVYRINAEHFLLVVNAANTEKDFAWISRHAESPAVDVQDTSQGYGLLALQGPLAERILQELADYMLDRIPYYWSQRVSLDGLPTRVSRTGYTGEDGFEILCDPESAAHLWHKLLVKGREAGLLPCGLAARNTLRLEAAYRLCGTDMDETTTPIEAGLGWIVKLGKGEFSGRDVLARQKQEGIRRKLVGFEVMDRAPARDGYPVLIAGRQVGAVSSGSPAPYLKKNIGLVYLPVEHAAVGTEFSISVRAREIPARVVETPFYKRERRLD